MPNRILKESICTSETIEQLDWFDEAVFYRLIVNCDDFGRFDGRASLLKSRLFPLRASVSGEMVVQAVERLAEAGLLWRYMVDGLPYIQLTTWEKHQRIRAKRSRYPEPDPRAQDLSHACGEGTGKSTGDDREERAPTQPSSDTKSKTKSAGRRAPKESAKTSENKPVSQDNGESRGHLLSIDDTCRRNPIRIQSESESESESCTALPAADRSAAASGRSAGGRTSGGKAPDQPRHGETPKKTQKAAGSKRQSTDTQSMSDGDSQQLSGGESVDRLESGVEADGGMADTQSMSDGDSQQLSGGESVNRLDSGGEADGGMADTQSTSDADQTVIRLPMLRGESYPVMMAQVVKWRALYPAVDVDQALRKMYGWLEANPRRQKTKTGILPFIHRWLAREQDKPARRIDDGREQTADEGASFNVDDFEKMGIFEIPDVGEIP